MNKKGLSDVISTVLIILLVLAAVVIVWVFVRQAIQRSAERISSDCLTAEIEPVNCNATSDVVSYKYSSGDATLSGVKLIIINADGSSAVVAASAIPGKFETKNMDLGLLATPIDVLNTMKLKSAAVVNTASGGEMICPESSKTVNCAD